MGEGSLPESLKATGSGNPLPSALPRPHPSSRLIPVTLPHWLQSSLLRRNYSSKSVSVVLSAFFFVVCLMFTALINDLLPFLKPYISRYDHVNQFTASFSSAVETLVVNRIHNKCCFGGETELPFRSIYVAISALIARQVWFHDD